MSIGMTLIFACCCWKPISHRSIELIAILTGVCDWLIQPSNDKPGVMGLFLNVNQQAVLSGFTFFVFSLLFLLICALSLYRIITDDY